MIDPVIKKNLRIIEGEIRRQRFGKEPQSLYEPIRYIMGLGGKRLRPMLTLLAYQLYRSDVERVAPYAVAVEAFHNFTLMHDDIMDKAPLRRGKPTVHQKWNTNTAILSGDVMLVKVYEMFRTLDPEKFADVVGVFNVCAAEVCEGQQWDMDFEARTSVTEAEYLKMIRLKTAVLLGFSLELGAMLADAPKSDRKALREFGIAVGMGFQLKDDLLDAFADPDVFGKQTGGDILANKKTFLLIKALERARGKNKTNLKYWLEAKRFRKAEKVNAVKEIYENLGIPSITERRINRYFRRGFRLLDSVSGREEAKEVLSSYTHALIARIS